MTIEQEQQNIQIVKDFFTGSQMGPGLFPLLGIWEIRDGRIKAWRDYFDPRPWMEAFPDAAGHPGLGTRARSGLL